MEYQLAITTQEKDLKIIVRNSMACHFSAQEQSKPNQTLIISKGQRTQQKSSCHCVTSPN